MKPAFITCTANYIGSRLARLLLQEGWEVAGYEGITDYYGVTLKQRRHGLLREHEPIAATEAMLDDAIMPQNGYSRRGGGFCQLVHSRMFLSRPNCRVIWL